MGTSLHVPTRTSPLILGEWSANRKLSGLHGGLVLLSRPIITNRSVSSNSFVKTKQIDG